MLIVLNFHIASEIFFASRAANYSYLCQSVSYSYDPNEMRVIHILMYSYYGLSAIGPSVYPYLWWKKYLTIIQLIQFIFGMCHAFQSLGRGCNFPVWMHWALIFYGGSLLLLFLNFYHKSYLNKKNKSSQNASVSCNGLPHTEDTSNNTIPSSPLSRDTILRRRSLHPHDH
ncbi:ELOVL4 [Acanthosepion pharaonis]|uniref:Elongation of very long chain fatty acids protein n=1 Tax=Acanthosepion pharaonis TaxID=158019 RepID=A0A812DP65_ACAPH|nr:ELOVL4 [Sepia pharaonis]